MEVINNGHVSKKRDEKKQKKDENTKSLPLTNINCLSLFYLTPYRIPYKIKKKLEQDLTSF